MKTVVNKFFAVTATSIYLVEVVNGSPQMTKIALKGHSKVLVGDILKDGTMLSIGKYLILFIPEGGGNTFEKNIAMVNTRYWGANTSQVKALFLDEKDARDCFENKSGRAEWISKTREVLNGIGDDHPQFTIATHPIFPLLAGGQAIINQNTFKNLRKGEEICGVKKVFKIELANCSGPGKYPTHLVNSNGNISYIFHDGENIRYKDDENREIDGSLVGELNV
jgi:hypothetical protein